MIDRNRVANQLELILELVDAIKARLKLLSRENFLADPAEIDLMAFRLSHIGEAARRLPTELTNRHPHIPWKLMVDMRNIIAHDYRRIDPLRIWLTAANDLEPVAEACTIELDSLS